MTTLRRPSLALLGALPVLTLAACGGGGGKSDKDKLTDIIKEGGKNPATVCDHATKKVIDGLGGKDKCIEASKDPSAKDPNVKVDSVTVNGDKATVKITGNQGKQTVKFVKEDGDWKVTAD